MIYKNKSFMTKRKAFTLVELLIVIAIIGILFIVLISKVDFVTDKSKATGVQTDFRSFQMAFETVSRENAGFNTFGWDTGDLNANGKRDSYDEGDTNKDNVEDVGEVWTGRKVPGETFTKVFTLVKPGTTFETNGYDADAIAKLETAINANLDPKLHITIATDGEITMANGARDPWDKEYHGWYITNAETDGKDRGAIVIYSDGANNEFGSEHKIANGIVSVSVLGNNKLGKDDYSIAVIYTFVNGYGEVKTQTSGFSQNQEGTNNSNNSNNGGNEGDVNSVPAIGDTKQFATVITTTILNDIYNLSTSPDKEYDYASIAYNDNTYLCIDYFDDVYDIYYEFYNESEDYWYCFLYVTEELVALGDFSESGWYAYDDYGNLVPCTAPYITFAQDLTIDMPNGLTDIAPLFVEANLPQSTLETNVPYMFNNIYFVFKDDGNVVGFYDEIVPDIIEGGDDISLQAVEPNVYGTYRVFIDIWGKEMIKINDEDPLELALFIKTNKTYHDVFDSEMYIVLLMNCLETKYYNQCDLEATISLTYNNGQFVDKNGNSYNDFNGIYIYNNVVFNEYDEAIGYVSMDGQYIEIYDNCNHYFLSKKGDVSRAEVVEPYLNTYGFYENAIYKTGDREVIFYSTGDFSSFKWRYDDLENAILVYQEHNGVVREKFLLTDNPNEILLIDEYDNSTEIFTRDINWKRQGILLEFVYECCDEWGTVIMMVCHADKSVTIKDYSSITTIQADEIFYTYEVYKYPMSFSISDDGNYLYNLFWYE